MSQIKNNELTHTSNSGTSNIVMASNGDVTTARDLITTGDLTVTGNDIKSSGATAITMSGANVTIAGTCTASGGFVGAGLFTNYAILWDEKSNNTSAGSSVSSTWTTRDLNQEVDPGSITSISSNKFTLQPGDYLIRWHAPAFDSDRHQTRLYNVTDTAVIEYGSSEWTGDNDDNWPMSRSHGSARLTVASSAKEYRIEHNVESGKGSEGLGRAAGMGGVEMYTFVEIFKEG